MNKLKPSIVFLFFLLLQTSYGQRWGLDPDLSFLKGQKELNIVFSYDSMTINTRISSMGFDEATFLEPDFVKQRTEKLNKRAEYKGDKWAKDWYAGRNLYFEPKFEKELNNKLKKGGIHAIKNNPKANYTLIIHTTNILFGRTAFPGFSARNSRATKIATYCDYFFTIIEGEHPAKLMARSSAKLVYGQHLPVFGITKYKAKFVGACYKKAGKMIGKSMKKAMSK